MPRPPPTGSSLSRPTTPTHLSLRGSDLNAGCHMLPHQITNIAKEAYIILQFRSKEKREDGFDNCVIFPLFQRSLVTFWLECSCKNTCHHENNLPLTGNPGFQNLSPSFASEKTKTKKSSSQALARKPTKKISLDINSVENTCPRLEPIY